MLELKQLVTHHRSLGEIVLANQEKLTVHMQPIRNANVTHQKFQRRGESANHYKG